ncbi:MAG TPA: DPP IV N-terminal domain-containing protein [Longimicrobiales bacterium]|nr:DPP IV N-terminal domain-containing protein [Longimicrobiales bacterium]
MRYCVVLPLVLFAALPAAAQQATSPAALSTADYQRAERMLGSFTNPLVLRASVRPMWLEAGRFWYRNIMADGEEYVLVDPAVRSRERAFDHQRVAAALSAAADTTFTPMALPISDIEFSADRRTVTLAVGQARYECEASGTGCIALPAEPSTSPVDNAVVSPDGRRAAFIRDHDLWVVETESGVEARLTTDGVEDHGYATNNAGWTKSDRPVLVWSPDSRRIATFRHDARGVGMMYLTTTEVGHPQLEAWRYPLPGDSLIFRIERVIIDVDNTTLTSLRMPPDPHRSTFCDHVYCGGTWADVEWYPDASHVAFVSSSRDHKEARLRVANASTGEVREVLEEIVATQYESGEGGINWRVLPASNEVIWFSERSDWGNLYLYDLATGELKHPITTGEGPVLDIVRIDETSRTLWFLGAGRESGRDPYFQHLYRVSLDGGQPRLLTPENANHSITVSPDGRFFVDTWSTPDSPPVTVVRELDDGDRVMTLEEADISRLRATGWTPPIPFTVKARDGVTDLHGLMYRPTDFDSTRSYPILNYLYPGPQSGSVGSRSFSAARSDKRAIAELGFIVVEVDAMGTPTRSKSFHDAYYGNMGDNGLPDQITMIEQLATRHSWLDVGRVGIWGHSGGGFAAADAIMRYPDFYKVAVSQAGNHDNRLYEDDWGERYQGLLVEYPDGTTNYDNQANQLLAPNLRGKLLIAHGTLDGNVPPYSTLIVVNELIRHNKDFDLIMFPNRRHGFGNEPYMMRRRWDYFVKWLMGAEPPAEFEFGAQRLAPSATSDG